MMNAKRNALLIGLTALVLARAWGAETEAARKDLAQLQGEWSMAGTSRDGRAIPDEMVRNSRRTCLRDETTVVVEGQLLMKAKFTLDPSTTPRSIDYQIIGGPNAGKRQQGIYELEGDTVKFCFSAPGMGRPTSFATKAGDGRTSSVWKREKKVKK